MWPPADRWRCPPVCAAACEPVGSSWVSGGLVGSGSGSVILRFSRRFVCSSGPPAAAGQPDEAPPSSSAASPPDTPARHTPAARSYTHTGLSACVDGLLICSRSLVFWTCVASASAAASSPPPLCANTWLPADTRR